MGVQSYVSYSRARFRLQEKMDLEMQIAQEKLLFELYDALEAQSQLEEAVSDCLKHPEELFDETDDVINRYRNFLSLSAVFRHCNRVTNFSKMTILEAKNKYFVDFRPNVCVFEFIFVILYAFCACNALACINGRYNESKYPASVPPAWNGRSFAGNELSSAGKRSSPPGNAAYPTIWSDDAPSADEETKAKQRLA